MFKVFVEKYTSLLQRRPFSSRVITTGAIIGLGDLISQFIVEKRSLFAKEEDKQFDSSRNIRAVCVGSFAMSPNLIIWYQHILPAIMARKVFRNLSPIKKAFCGMAIDQCCFSFWIISNFMFWVSFFEYRDVEKGIENVKMNLVPTLKVNWMFWPTISFVNQMYVPLMYRTLYVNFFSLWWNLYLSVVNQKGKQKRLELANINKTPNLQARLIISQSPQKYIIWEIRPVCQLIQRDNQPVILKQQAAAKYALSSEVIFPGGNSLLDFSSLNPIVVNQYQKVIFRSLS